MKTTSLTVLGFASLLCLTLVAQEAAKATSGVIKRSGEPDCFEVTDNNKEMAQAVQKARKTLPKFLVALRSPKSTQSRFAVKKPFIEGEKVEHIWVNNLSFDDRVFHGKVDNEPVDLKNVHLGDEVTVSPEDISDWMFVQDGKLVGGYTVRCACHHMSPAQKKRFEANANCRID